MNIPTNDIDKIKKYFVKLVYGNNINDKENNFIRLLKELHSYSYQLQLPETEKKELLNKYNDTSEGCNLLTYGWTPYSEFSKIISKIENNYKIDKNRKFICIGSSHGNFVFYANYLLGMPSVGYDISPTRINKANEISNKFKINNIKFLNKGGEEASDFSDASIIWLSDLCFPKAVIEKLSNKIKKECKDCLVIFMNYRHNIKNTHSIVVDASWARQSWIYAKIN